MICFSESQAEEAVLEWLSGLGYVVLYSPDISTDGNVPQRANYGDVIISDRFRGALAEKTVQAVASRFPTDGEWQQDRSSGSSYGKLHDKLVERKKLIAAGDNGVATFTEDTPFSSPSAASAVIFGRADNGRKSWRVIGKNITYADWQAQQVVESAVEA